MLSRHTENELRQAKSGAKRMAMLTMRQQIGTLRAKVHAMEGQP